jgi:hypothetical protein
LFVTFHPQMLFIPTTIPTSEHRAVNPRQSTAQDTGAGPRLLDNFGK